MEESDKLANSEHRVTSQITTKEANKVALGALVGNAIEWYDFFLFSAAAALVFNVQYFATDSATDSAMAAFATFGVGLVARPVGGAIFGAIGDTVGRKNVLLITVIGIGIVTALIGMLPTYAAIGVAAPILLILLRILQGLFVGGEWSGAMTIVVENAPLKRRALYAAIPQIGSPIGTIMSSGFFFIMGVMLTQDSFDAWGWRIPFLFAIPLVLVGAWLRSKLEESPVFEALKEEGEVEKAPFIAIFKNNWLQIIIGVLVAVVGVAGFYLVTSFVVWYGVNILGYSQDLMLIGTFVAAAVEIPVLYFGGRLGVKIGASRVVIYGGILSVIASIPAFLLIISGVPILVILGMTLAVAGVSVPYAASGTVMTGLFPAKTRYSGVAWAQNIAGMIAGFVPLAATAWVAAAGNQWWPAAAILFILSAVTVVGGILAPKASVAIPGFKH
ncbi:MFS transporter [Agrococcus casei]|uniref:MFS transporter n=3 Tax=Agrococcus casei TaxID=343512 RepID=UPI003F93EB23